MEVDEDVYSDDSMDDEDYGNGDETSFLQDYDQLNHQTETALNVSIQKQLQSEQRKVPQAATTAKKSRLYADKPPVNF